MEKMYSGRGYIKFFSDKWRNCSKFIKSLEYQMNLLLKENDKIKTLPNIDTHESILSGIKKHQLLLNAFEQGRFWALQQGLWKSLLFKNL